MGLLFGCSALHGKDNAISDVKRGDGAFVPFIFPWFQYLLTIRNNDAGVDFRKLYYSCDHYFL